MFGESALLCCPSRSSEHPPALLIILFLHEPALHPQNLCVLCTIFKCIHFVSLNRIKWRAQSNYTRVIRSRDMMDFTPGNRSPLKKKRREKIKKKPFHYSFPKSPTTKKKKKRLTQERLIGSTLLFVFVSLHPNMLSFCCDRVVCCTGGTSDEERGQTGP